MTLITVAICTWNRADLLDKTLERMRDLHAPEGLDWEILVVNNNCTDHTDDVIVRHADALPLRRLVETKQGHSHARNCAIDAARGELLIWTDDDVLVHPDWLTEYVKAAEAFPAAAYFGGPIDPWFESEPPAWMRRHWDKIRGVFVIRDFGPEVRLIEQNERPAGANMAFRTELLRQNRFDTRLGRVGATLTGADDTEVVLRFKDAGYQGVWIGTARVEHFLPAQRLTKKFLFDWYHGAGRTYLRQSGATHSVQLFGAPRWALFGYVKSSMKSWLFAPFKGDRWFAAFCQAANLKGYLTEHWESARNTGEAELNPELHAIQK